MARHHVLGKVQFQTASTIYLFQANFIQKLLSISFFLRYCRKINKKAINSTTINLEEETDQALSREKICTGDKIRTTLNPSQNCKDDFILDKVDNDFILKKTYWTHSHEFESANRFCLLEYNGDRKAAKICSNVKENVW